MPRPVAQYVDSWHGETSAAAEEPAAGISTTAEQPQSTLPRFQHLSHAFPPRPAAVS